MAVPTQAPTQQPNTGAGPEATETQPSVPSPAETPASTPATEQAPRPDFFREAFASRYVQVAPAAEPPAPEKQPETPPASPPPSEPASGQEPPAETRQKPQKAIPPPDDFERRVQSEVDRRMDKWQRETVAQQRAERERQLRDTDPYAYTELLREREKETTALQTQLQQAHQLVASNVNDYDRQVLDPLILALPQQMRQDVLAQSEEGIAGRGKVAGAALKALQQHYRAEGLAQARKTLMTDQAFIKEILARYGGQRTEPDTVPGVATTPAQSWSFNDEIRRAAGRPVR